MNDVWTQEESTYPWQVLYSCGIRCCDRLPRKMYLYACWSHTHWLKYFVCIRAHCQKKIDVKIVDISEDHSKIWWCACLLYHKSLIVMQNRDNRLFSNRNIIYEGREWDRSVVGCKRGDNWSHGWLSKYEHTLQIREKRPLRTGIVWRIILKLILKKWDGITNTGFISLTTETRDENLWTW